MKRLLILLLFLTSTLHAQLFDELWNFSKLIEDKNTGLTTLPILTIPSGGESEGMGTAVTSISRDSSFFDYNPAGSSRLGVTELSVLHNNWIADSSVESIIYTTRFGDLGLGGMVKFLHVPFTRYDRTAIQVSSARFTETQISFNISYTFFRSFDWSGLSLGTNIEIGHRRVPSELYSGISETNQNITAFSTDFGLQTSFDVWKPYPSRNDNVHLGVSFVNFGVSSNGEPLPTQARFGIGYYPTNWLLLTSDFIQPIIFGYSNGRSGYAFGNSIDVTYFFNIRSGILLLGGNPRFSLGTDLELIERLSLTTNYTFDLTTSGPLDRISIGARFNYGDRGRAELQKSVEEFYLDGIRAFALGNLALARIYLEKAIELDDSFTPASEALSSVHRLLFLEERMRSIKLQEMQ